MSTLDNMNNNPIYQLCEILITVPSISSFLDSVRPSFLYSTPEESITNSKFIWFTFELSEPILLLPDDRLSLVENVKLVSERRLLSMICSEGMSGDCIEVLNANVIEGIVADSRYVCCNSGNLYIIIH